MSIRTEVLARRSVLRDPRVEKPVTEFDVAFVLFGTETRPATRQRIRVMAETTGGAVKICRVEFPRSAEHQAQRAAGQQGLALGAPV